MISGLRVLGVIPARAGSKRVPGKNYRNFRGKPLVQWTVECAKESRYIDSLVCSTDCLTVAQIAHAMGVITIPRPKELATDEASSEDVLRHVLGTIPADIVVLLQPTSPLRLPEDIDACIDHNRLNQLDPQNERPIISVCEVEGGRSEKNGAVYVAKAAYIRAGGNFSATDFWPYPMPAERSLDIDHEWQFGPLERAVSERLNAIPHCSTLGIDALPGYVS